MSFLCLIMPQNVCTGGGRANEIPLLRIPQVRFGDCNSLKTKTGVYQICLNFQWWWVVKPLGSQNRELAFLSWCHHFTDQWCVLCFGGEITAFIFLIKPDLFSYRLRRVSASLLVQEPNGRSWPSTGRSWPSYPIVPKCSQRDNQSLKGSRTYLDQTGGFQKQDK